jgi:flagellar hook-associated protein 2
MENKYYKQFSAMESAMAKMQSQSNALAGMLGTNSGK